MEEHEKNCPKAVCDFTGSNDVQSMPLHHGMPTDCYTLVIPKLPSSTGINISISSQESKNNNRENKKKICDNES